MSTTYYSIVEKRQSPALFEIDFPRWDETRGGRKRDRTCIFSEIGFEWRRKREFSLPTPYRRALFKGRAASLSVEGSPFAAAASENDLWREAAILV